MKVFFDVIGCRLNQSEVEQLAISFRALGHQIVGDAAQADVAIINTCSVTTKAAADSRKKLRRAARLGAKRVVATGCWATLFPEQALDLEGVTDVFNNQNKGEIVSSLLNVPPHSISTLNLVREPLPGDRARTRAFIKIQEGCDHHCTYCLTRLARGRSQSRDFDVIKRDIHSAVAGGTKEIVLTGVQLGSWGRDLPEPKRLSDLLERVLALSGFERLRLSSIEPWDFEGSLLALWQDERMCRHLHLPLQSADDRILNAMARPMTSHAFRMLIESIQSAIPHVAVTTDVIVGFPGETEEAFINTRSFIQAIDFAGGHVFTFSPRPGTAANKMKNKVSASTARVRSLELRNLFTQKAFAFRDRFIETQLPVLWESASKQAADEWQLSGLTDNYLRVYAKASSNLWNEITPVVLKGHRSDGKGLMGEML